MKPTFASISLFFIVCLTSALFAQESPFRRMETIAEFQRPFVDTKGISMTDGRIKNFHAFDAASGIVYTSTALFRTFNGGRAWEKISLPRGFNQRISSVNFADSENGSVLFYDVNFPAVAIARTTDGGRTWTSSAAVLPGVDDLDLENADLTVSGTVFEITARIPTSSNFEGRAKFTSYDAGASWQLAEKSIELRSNEGNELQRREFGWSLAAAGECSGFKTGCLQIVRLTIDGLDATPSPILESIEQQRKHVRNESEKVRQFALPPGGSIRTSLNRGFDKCTNGSVSQMQIWWDYSYFFDANIYFSGRNRACSQSLSASWVNQVSSMGWGLIPTVVGYQSPCTASATSAKFSYDTATAESQGRGEADIATADAANIGLTAGSVIYYDMERYDETAATPGCRTATTAFLKGWTERIRELGYTSGVYGSPRNAIDDWQFMPPASRMDAVWMARWDNVMSVWTYLSFSTFPNNVWNDHQRIKQWQAPHNETWGGVTFNIDGNVADGPVAGITVPRNKAADFDGDGKTDISVFRPSSGQWFIAGTLGPSFNVYEYGTSEDILTPGDYDGDGRTDLVVFRPSNSTWYLRMKGAFNVRQYGEPGDIPAAADYNGDGRTDIALFRPSTGVWYIAFSDSRNSFAQISFGQAGDRPASADYDGDGKADIAVWRPSNGTWYVQGTAGNYFAAEWGVAADVPAQADYDGDGRVDLAVFRPSLGRWYIFQTTNGIRIQDFGIDGDLPTPGDYDGDGRYDVSVFRPSNNNWYMSQSQAGYVVREFGTDGDKTIPGAYLPR